MALKNLLGDIALDATAQATNTKLDTANTTLAAIESLQQSVNTLNDTMVVLLSLILDKLPRVTGNAQAAVSVETGSISAVTTVTTLSNHNLIGTKPISGDNQMMAGAMHIYNQIGVS